MCGIKVLCVMLLRALYVYYIHNYCGTSDSVVKIFGCFLSRFASRLHAKYMQQRHTSWARTEV